jgi:hypothetical protein
VAAREWSRGGACGGEAELGRSFFCGIGGRGGGKGGSGGRAGEREGEREGAGFRSDTGPTTITFGFF